MLYVCFLNRPYSLVYHVFFLQAYGLHKGWWKRAAARAMLWGDGVIFPSDFMLRYVETHQGACVLRSKRREGMPAATASNSTDLSVQVSQRQSEQRATLSARPHRSWDILHCLCCFMGACVCAGWGFGRRWRETGDWGPDRKVVVVVPRGIDVKQFR